MWQVLILTCFQSLVNTVLLYMVLYCFIEIMWSYKIMWSFSVVPATEVVTVLHIFEYIPYWFLVLSNLEYFDSHLHFPNCKKFGSSQLWQLMLRILIWAVTWNFLIPISRTCSEINKNFFVIEEKESFIFWEALKKHW